MTKLQNVFIRQDKNHKALVVYLTPGCPSLEKTKEYIKILEQEGVDLIEIGIPFSDPLADGPLLQKAGHCALQGGITTKKILAMVKELKGAISIPLAVMTYFNPVLQYGVENFVKDFSAAGIVALLVPDLPLEESSSLHDCCAQHQVDLIQFIAPTTPLKRLEKICKKAQGFIYCVSNTGVTGVKAIPYEPLKPLIAAAKKYCSVPVAIGFGIGSPEAASQVAKIADGAIVGTAVMQRILSGEEENMRLFVRSLRQALDAEEHR